MSSSVTSSRRRLKTSIAAFFIATAAASVARATPEEDAKNLFSRGRELRQSNDCGQAAPLFRKAWTIYPQALGSLRNLAECEEQLGHFASARRAWLDLKRALNTAAPDPKYDTWDQDAEQAAARLKPKVAVFVVDVYVSSSEGEALANENTGVELLINGERLGNALVGTPLERDPGTYLVRAQLEDASPVEQSVTVAAGDNPHVTIRLARRPKPVEAATTDEHATRRTVGWVVTGIGGAALIGSGITFLIRQGALSDLDEQCPSHEGCSQSLQGTVDRGQTMSTLTSILLPIGVFGVGAGLALVLTSRPSAEKKAAATTIRVTPTVGGLGVAGKF